MNTDPAENHFLNQIPVCILRMNWDFEILYSNEATSSILGHKKEEVIGKSFFSLIPELEQQKIKSFYATLGFTQSSYSESHFYLNSKINHAVYTDPEGVTVILKKEPINYLVDSSQKEASFRLVLDDLPGGIVIVDSSSDQIVYSNKVTQDWLGYNNEELNLFSFSNILAKEDLEFVKRQEYKNKDFSSEIHLGGRDGKKIPVEFHFIDLEWKNKPSRCMFFKDIRSEKEAEKTQVEWQKLKDILGVLAVKFINIPSSELGSVIEKTLGIAGFLSNSDRAFTLRFDLQNLLAYTEYTWVNEGIQSFKDDFKVFQIEMILPLFDRLINERFFEIEDVSHLPENSLLRKTLSLLNLKSLTLSTIFEGDVLYGVVGFGRVTIQEKYSESELIPITMVSEIISNTLLRKKTENLLFESEQENKKLFNNVSVGILYFDRNGMISKANHSALNLLDLTFLELQDKKILNPRWRAFEEGRKEIDLFSVIDQECIKSAKPVSNRIVEIHRPGFEDYVWLSIDSTPEFKSGEKTPSGVFLTLSDITDQKTLMDLAILSENRYRVLVENLPGAVYSFDLDKKMTIRHMSKKVFDFTGYSDLDFIKNQITFQDLIHPADKERTNASIDYSIKNHKPFQLEYRIYHKSGKIRWIEDMGDIIFKDKFPSHVIGFCRDITTRKEAQSESYKSQKLLEAIIENSHSVIFVKDLDLRYIMVNKRWEIITGYKREDILGKKLEDFLDTSQIQQYNDDDRKTIFEGKTTFKEEEITKEETKSGQGYSQYFLTLKFPYKDEDGAIIGMCGISTEITAIREASLMIEEREANLQGILESVNESIWSLDKNMDILYTNKTCFEEFFQYSGIELRKGINIINSIPDPSEREKWRKRYETVLESGSPLHISDMVKISNQKYYYESVIYPLKVNDRVEGVSVFSKNVTEKVDLDGTSKLYRSLFETSTNEIFLISSDSLQIKQANQAALKNTGYSIEEILDISFLDLISILTRDKIIKSVYPLISKKVTSVLLETSNLRKDGSSYEAEILLQWFVYDGEEFLSAFVSDISERKENQRALKESELRFTQIFKENVTPMLIVDPMNGQIEDANPAAISYYGFDPDSIKSKNVIDVNYTFEENPEKMVSAIENIMAQGKGKFEFIHKLQSGELRNVEVFCSKISINNRDLVHEIIQDVTERNNYYEALLKQNEALKEIAWIQSHIIRAPLAKIMGLVQILQDDKDDEDFSFDFILDAILNAANELDEVIQKTSEKSNQAKHLF